MKASHFLRPLLASAAALALLAAPSAFAQVTWNGTTTNGTWSTGALWDSGSAPTNLQTEVDPGIRTSW